MIGVGINILARDSTGLSTAAAWLQELQPGMDAGGALQRVTVPLVQTVREFESQGFAPFQRRFNALDGLAGQQVSLSDGTRGLAAGVDEAGALLVHTSTGLKKISSAEVSVRPVE